MGPFGSANGIPPHGAASTDSRIKGGRQVSDAEFIAGALGNVGLEIAYSKTATQTDVGGRAVCFESPALPSRWVLTLQLPPMFPICP